MHFAKNFAEVSRTPIFRGSHRRCSVREGVLKNFTKFTGKAGLRSATLLKKMFSCELCEISKNTFFTGHLSATLLYFAELRQAFFFPSAHLYITLLRFYYNSLCVLLHCFQRSYPKHLKLHHRVIRSPY